MAAIGRPKRQNNPPLIIECLAPFLFSPFPPDRSLTSHRNRNDAAFPAFPRRAGPLALADQAAPTYVRHLFSPPATATCWEEDHIIISRARSPFGRFVRAARGKQRVVATPGRSPAAVALYASPFRRAAPRLVAHVAA